MYYYLGLIITPILFLRFFFRKPERKSITDKIVSPCDGIVTKVAPTTTKSEDGKLEFYETVIEIDLKQRKNEKKVSLQSGMQVDVSIIGQERTVLSYLINPIRKLSKTALRD